MELITKQISDSFVLGINSDRISEKMVKDIGLCLRNFSHQKELALDLASVVCVCGEFLNLLCTISSERELSVINLQSEIFTLLNLTNHDRFVNIYLCEEDFLQSKHQLINRRFVLV